jgi:2,4-dienoyl-CoA reductase-like NADH-dependent reductase (Old Yellow Enzyme family)/thioredoxin reductase
MEQFVKLFRPGKIGKMEIKNRIVMAPLGLPLGTDPDGYPTNDTVAFYEARARGGVGLIQITTITSPGVSFGHRVTNLSNDERIPSVQRLTTALKSAGTGVKLSFLIGHAGVRQSEALRRRPPETHPELDPVVSASAIPHPVNGWMPRALDEDGIFQTAREFGLAAGRGKAAGFDACQVHGGHGYLIHQFLSPRTNKRTDRYGGSVQNRCRFACDIIAQIRKEAGPDFPIIFRMNGYDFLDDGISSEEAVEQARIFAAAGVDAIDISSGPRQSIHWQFITMYQPSGPLIPYAAAIKKAVKVPVIVAGKINPVLAERALQEGSADFIHMGRPLMVDPELPNKVKEGRLEDVRPCIYCNQCTDRRKLTGDPTHYCSVNPAMGRELQIKSVPAVSPKKVMVVGGGLAGMEAARILAERGHETSLYEKSDNLGGQWNILSVHVPEVGGLVKYLARGMDRARVKVFFNQEINTRMVQDLHPDVVVVAAGASPVLPKVPGINRQNVVLATDVLTGKVDVGQEVVIIGGHLVGLGAALLLAEQGKGVSVIEMRKIGWGTGYTLRLALMEKLIKNKVRMFPDCRLESVTEHGVNILWDSSDPMIKTAADQNEMLWLPADSVVLAVGSKSENRLAQELKGLMPEVYAIGDCVEPRDALAAIHEGSAVGRKI